MLNDGSWTATKFSQRVGRGPCITIGLEIEEMATMETWALEKTKMGRVRIPDLEMAKSDKCVEWTSWHLKITHL